jgi:hypothetical protein
MKGYVLKIRNSCKILVEESEKKRSIWRPKRRWKKSVTIDLKYIEYESGTRLNELRRRSSSWHS